MFTTANNERKRVAFLLADQFDDFAFNVPYTALNRDDVEVVIVGNRMNDTYLGERGQVKVTPDATAAEVRSSDFDALLIPGGSAPNHLRMSESMIRLVRSAFTDQTIVAAIGRGPQVLIEAEQLKGRQATGHPSIRKDIQNAGAVYIDQAVVEEHNVLTARRVGDLPLFATMLCDALHLSEGQSERSQQPQDAWWKVGQNWGGSTREEIVTALSSALAGEQYMLHSFQYYAEGINDAQAKRILEDIIKIKRGHIGLLEGRLAVFGEKAVWQQLTGAALASLQTWLQASDDITILRRSLGDLQTGIVDARGLSEQLTDPVTSGLLSDISTNLSRCEERLGALYRVYMGDTIKPPLPTTGGLR